MSAARLAKCVFNRSVVQCVKTRPCHRIISLKRPDNGGYAQPKRFLSTTQCLCKDTEDENKSDGNIPNEKGDAQKETIDNLTEQSETLDSSAEKNELQNEALDNESVVKKLMESQKEVAKASVKKRKPKKAKGNVSGEKIELQEDRLGVSEERNESPKETLDSDSVLNKIIESQKDVAKAKVDDSGEKSGSQKEAHDNVSVIDKIIESQKDIAKASEKKKEPKKAKVDVSVEKSEEQNEMLDVSGEKSELQKEKVVSARKKKSQRKKVVKAAPKNELKVSEKDGVAKESAETVESASSDSDSSSSSDSDVERSPKIRVDNEMKAAASAVAELLPGDKMARRNELLGRLSMKSKKDGSNQQKDRKGAKKKSPAMSNEQVEEYLMDRIFDVEGITSPPEDKHAQKKAFLHKMKSVPIAQKLAETEDDILTRDDGRPMQGSRQDDRDRRGPNNSTRRTMAQRDSEAKGYGRNTKQLDPKEIAEFMNKTAIGPFDAEPQGIFKNCENPKKDTGKKYLYNIIEEEKRQKMLDFVPRNAFEEQIQWTRQGKLWTFPIDNEAGWDEKNVSFQDHVFLDRQITDFPQKGPIRHFMEIVTVALSKNSYMTVQEKRDHIDWFRNYFKANEKVLVEQLGEMGQFTERVDQSSTSA